jgi:hypothetical protein
MNELFDNLEEQHGRITLWEWTREWLEAVPEYADNEKVSLEEYLNSRSEAEVALICATSASKQKQAS